jgi:hypothetical protein
MDTLLSLDIICIPNMIMVTRIDWLFSVWMPKAKLTNNLNNSHIEDKLIVHAVP